MKSIRNDYLQHEFMTDCKANSALHNHPQNRQARALKKMQANKKRNFAQLAKLAAFSIASFFS